MAPVPPVGVPAWRRILRVWATQTSTTNPLERVTSPSVGSLHHTTLSLSQRAEDHSSPTISSWWPQLGRSGQRDIRVDHGGAARAVAGLSGCIPHRARPGYYDKQSSREDQHAERCMTMCWTHESRSSHFELATYEHETTISKASCAN